MQELRQQLGNMNAINKIECRPTIIFNYNNNLCQVENLSQVG